MKRIGKKRLVVGVLLLAIVGVGSFVFINVMQPFTALSQGSPNAAEDSGKTFGAMYPTKERVINLADRDVFRYLKIEVVLEFAPDAAGASKGSSSEKKSKDLAEVMPDRVAVIEDALTTILSGKTTSDILTAQGKDRLREEIKQKLNAISGDKKIANVYFTQFIVQ